MALPSQSVSRNARGRYMYRRKRRNRIPTMAVIVVAALACSGIWWYLDSRSDQTNETPEPVTAAAATAPVDTGTATARFDAQRRSRALESTVTTTPPDGWTAGLSVPSTAPNPVTTPAPQPTPPPTPAPAPPVAGTPIKGCRCTRRPMPHHGQGRVINLIIDDLMDVQN